MGRKKQTLTQQYWFRATVNRCENRRMGKRICKESVRNGLKCLITMFLLFFFPQLLWRATRRTWSEAANTARAHEGTWSCGNPRNQAWTRSCTGWMKTWPPPPSAWTKSLSATWRACPPILPTPSLCTSCPVPILWPVSLLPLPLLLLFKTKQTVCGKGFSERRFTSVNHGVHTTPEQIICSRKIVLLFRHVLSSRWLLLRFLSFQPCLFFVFFWWEESLMHWWISLMCLSESTFDYLTL